MGTALAPTDKQPRMTFETPWGTATVNDWRSASEADKMYAALASVVIPEVIINGKNYGQITLYLERAHTTHRWTQGGFGPNFTPAAWDKFYGFWKVGEDMDPAFLPYIAPLSADSTLADHTARALYELNSAIYTARTKSNVSDEALDAAIAKITALRATGVSYASREWNL